MLKKCTMFYAAVVSETVPEHFDFGGIRKISPQKIKTDLLFSDREVLSRIEQHPMALWKCGRKSDQEK